MLRAARFSGLRSTVSIVRLFGATFCRYVTLTFDAIAGHQNVKTSRISVQYQTGLG